MQAAKLCPDLCLGSPRFDGLARPPAELFQLLRESALRDGAAAACRRLSGSYAVGVWLDNGTPLLAVDRFAMQTLCWRFDADAAVRFSARADVLAHPSQGLDEQALFEYLYFHAIPSPRTAWLGVHRLPPGHFLTLQAGVPVVLPYWQPRFTEPVRADFRSLAAEFRELLKAGVKRALDGSRPACYLSGGTDSSTVAGMIGQVAGQPAATFSIGFDASGYDEMAYARIAAKAYGTEHHEYYVTPADLVAGIPKVAASYDQPFGNSSALPAFYCAAMARDHGISHILAGDGGDELFGGNTRYAKQQLFEIYSRVPALVRGTMIEPMLRMPAALKLPWMRKGASYVEQARLPMPARQSLYNLALRLGVDQVFAPSLLARFDQLGPSRHQQEVWDFADAPSVLNRELAYDWRYTLGEVDLPKVRGTAELAGLSVGFPLLDDDLVAFSAGLPCNYKLRGNQLRWFFKEALRGFLPNDIITKSKHGFGLPFGTWVVQPGALRDLSVDAVYSLERRRFLRLGFARTLIEENLQQHPAYFGEMIWILTMLEHWLLRHFPQARF